MSTNYYRIPAEHEMKERWDVLVKRINELEMTPSAVRCRFSTIPTHDSNYVWEYESPWEEFTRETSIHLGKRSKGWKFLWNFNKNKYFYDKKSLVEFVYAGRIVDEHGEEHDPHEFLSMAFEWGSDCENGGWPLEQYYRDYPEHRSEFNSMIGSEKWIDGLRASDSTDFC